MRKSGEGEGWREGEERVSDVDEQFDDASNSSAAIPIDRSLFPRLLLLIVPSPLS